ncbi:MAG: glycosyltransferase family 2 protein [Clostridia bacterium]|nr:glycosyltransferase family 2 protein [Clostridia bacterium]
MKVDILMATYNGEKYIGKQIESIIEQTYKDWTLYIRDDASNDNTMIIVRQYAGNYPGKIKFIVNSENSGSPKANFFKLIKNSKADVIFTCDQDDIWEKDKIELTLKAFEGESKPLLVHTDLKIIDEKDSILCESMVKSQHIDITRTGLNKLLVQNIVTGCTMAFNRELADILIEPELIPVHDWWIAAVASAFGNIRYIDKSTIRYRKHMNNACGPQNMNNPHYVVSRARDKCKAKKMLGLGYVMAAELLEKYKMPYKYNRMLKDYSAMAQKNKLQKFAVIFKYGIWKSGILRKAGQLWFM